ncbi:lipocalin family protein [Paraburkholderia graminis]
MCRGSADRSAAILGKWFVIAETPYLNERDHVGSFDEWTLRADGKIEDKYLGFRSTRHGKPLCSQDIRDG